MKLELTRKADLALRALLALGEDEQLKGSALADRIDTTPTYIAQIMQPLVQRGWVDSQPGPNGGYSLVEPLADISMLALIEAVEGPTERDECVLRGGPCDPMEQCALHNAWLEARAALLKTLATIPVATSEQEATT